MSDLPTHLWLRADAIGDSILSLGLLKCLRDSCSPSRFVAVCQERVAEIYSTLPWIIELITFDRNRAITDQEYRANLVNKIRAKHAAYCFCPIFSRDELTDVLAVGSGARQVVTFRGDSASHHFPAMHQRALEFYDLLVEPEPCSNELQRYEVFSRRLGTCGGGLMHPLLPGESPEKFADHFFAANNLDPAKTLAFFPGAQQSRRETTIYAAALNAFCREHNFSVIALGDAASRSINQANLQQAHYRAFDLAGETTLLEAAALIARCRLALGAETSLGHMAAAMGTPNVIVLGGGHFGRFCPTHVSTTAVALPLSCFGCNWKCRFGNYPCVSALTPKMISIALSRALENQMDRPVVFLQGESLSALPDDGPTWSLAALDGLTMPMSIELIERRGTMTLALDNRRASRDRCHAESQGKNTALDFLNLQGFLSYYGVSCEISPLRNAWSRYRIDRVKGVDMMTTLRESASYARRWLSQRGAGTRD